MTNATNLLEQLRVQKAKLDEQMKGLKLEQKQATQKQVEARISEVIKALNPKTQFQVGLQTKAGIKNYTAVEFNGIVFALTNSGNKLSRIVKEGNSYDWA